MNEKVIKFPIRVSRNDPSIKDSDNRIIIKTPISLLNDRSEGYEKRLEQYIDDIEHLVEIANLGYKYLEKVTFKESKRELKASLGYSRIGRDAMRRG